MKQNFHLISWEKNFLPHFTQYVKESSNNTLEECLYIFPHQRAKKYANLTLEILEEKSACIIPEMFTINQYNEYLFQKIRKKPYQLLGTLDRVAVLLDCVKKISKENVGEDLFLPGNLHAESFFPWGVRLSSLFEEAFSQLCTIDNFAYELGQTQEYAARLISKMGDIFALYIQQLKENNWATPAYMAFELAQWIQAGNAIYLHPTAHKYIYIAGFHSLAKSEEVLFKHLWQEHKAHILLHADPQLVLAQEDKKKHYHWTCKKLYTWAQHWNSKIVLYDTEENADFEEKQDTSKIHFYESFDLHSQLKALKEQLQKQEIDSAEKNSQQNDTAQKIKYSAETAIVLLNPSLLLPALHHLPDQRYNISMGYPLERSSFFQFLQIILQLQESKRHERYYWQDLVHLIRHPYFKVLIGTQIDFLHTEEVGQSGEQQQKQDDFLKDTSSTFRLYQTILHQIESAIRKGQQRFINFVEVSQIVEEQLGKVDQDSLNVFAHKIQQVFKECLEDFADIQSPKELAISIRTICTKLVHRSEGVWQSFPIDAECIYQFQENTLTNLQSSLLAEEEFSQKALFQMLRQLVKEERVPFSSSPLIGSQVLGLLETRTLSFKNLYIVDAVDSLLPGLSAADPLLPDGLRSVLGLWSIEEKNTLAAYHFFRLLASCENIHIFWQEGAQSSDQQKSIKSRFVEELLWEEEKKQNVLLNSPSSTIPYTVLSAQLAPIKKAPTNLAITDTMRDLVFQRLAKGISPSFLDAFIKCPIQFYYERIVSLNPIEEIDEKSSPVEIGKLLHRTLYSFFSNYLGKSFPPKELSATELEKNILQIFYQTMSEEKIGDELPADAISILNASAKVHLAKIAHTSSESVPLALELELQKEVLNISEDLPLIFIRGKIDRLDFEKECLWIKDYKTGKSPQVKSSIWENRLFWEKLEAAVAQKTLTMKYTTIAPFFAKELQSIQLPSYLYLLHCNKSNIIDQQYPHYKKTEDLNAKYIPLIEPNSSNAIFSIKASCQDRLLYVTEYTPLMLKFFIKTITESEAYPPIEGEHCTWCSCRNICTRTL